MRLFGCNASEPLGLIIRQCNVIYVSTGKEGPAEEYLSKRYRAAYDYL
jgi:hypothetical protein